MRSRSPSGGGAYNRVAVAYETLSAEQQELRDLIRALAAEKIAPRAAEIDETGEFPWDVVEALREADVLALPFPERYGGTGTGSLMLLVAIEELSKVCATTGLILAVQSLGALALELSARRGRERDTFRVSPQANGSARTRSPRPDPAPTRRPC